MSTPSTPSKRELLTWCRSGEGGIVDSVVGTEGGQAISRSRASICADATVTFFVSRPTQFRNFPHLIALGIEITAVLFEFLPILWSCNNTEKKTKKKNRTYGSIDCPSLYAVYIQLELHLLNFFCRFRRT